MRYTTKFNNGMWKVFDTVQYGDVDLNRDSSVSWFPTAKEVAEIAERMNARTASRK